MTLAWLKHFIATRAKEIVAVTATAIVAYGLYKYCFSEDEYFKRIRSSTKPSKDKVVLVIGLDDSGKTCFLQSFGAANPLIKEPPRTPAICSVSKTIGNVKYTLYEVGTGGGLIKARKAWPDFVNSLKIKAVVMVIDSADHQRINQARIALSQFSEEINTENINLLILANKQDNAWAMKPNKVKERITDSKYKYKSLDVIGTTVGPGKKRFGVYSAYKILSSF